MCIRDRLTMRRLPRWLTGFYRLKTEKLFQTVVWYSAVSYTHLELEYGSPKKPALVEAVALNLADNTDARMEIGRAHV